MEDSEQILFTPNHALRALDISRSKLYGLMKSGELRFVMIGGDRRIPAEELKRIAREGAPNKPSKA